MWESILNREEDEAQMWECAQLVPRAGRAGESGERQQDGLSLWEAAEGFRTASRVI